jgi:ComF family protein
MNPYHQIRTFCYDGFEHGKELFMQWVQQSKRQLGNIVRRGMDLIYPPQCACCRAEIEGAEYAIDLCEECKNRLIPKIWAPCPRCGGLTEGVIKTQKGCMSCSGTLFHFDSVVALGSYHTDLRQIILRMKRSSNAPLALAMGSVLSTERREILANLQLDLVIPIPMYWMQSVFRGMNSPEFIARSLGKTLDIPVRRWVLTQCKKTLTQSELPPKQRIINVRGAFRVRFAHQIHNRRILLVDDVLTTGATCNEAAKTLKEAGASTVVVAVVARTLGGSR